MRRPDPADTSNPGAGNRFDSFHGNFAVLYGATSPEACYAETLARFRPDPRLSELVRTEWAQNSWMSVGSVPADWRNSRVLARVVVNDALPFLDVAHPDTLASFREEIRISSWLESFGVGDLDLAHVIGHDRRVTRLIAQWAAETTDEEGRLTYGGIRYVSRLGEGYECWAIFEGSDLSEVERRSVLTSDADLCAVAVRYGLTIH